MPEVPAAISDRVESVRLAIAGALRDRVIGTMPRKSATPS
jgi:hypothetical protein